MSSRAIWLLALLALSYGPDWTSGYQARPQHQPAKQLSNERPLIRINLNKADGGRQQAVSSLSQLGRSIADNKPSSVATAAHEPLVSYYRSPYYGQIGLGTPRQKFNVIFDTMSPYTWIPSINCTDFDCGEHPRYDGSKSSTYKRNGQKISIPYPDGLGVEGTLSQDSLSVAGLTIANQTFVDATQLPWLVFLKKFDGVLGLGFGRSSKHGVASPFENMVAQRLVPEPVFSFYLNNNNEPGSQQRSGELILGGIDHNHISGKIVYTSLTHQHHWQIQLEGFSIGSADGVSSLGVAACVGGCPAIVSTGSPLIQGPHREILAINAVIKAYKEDFGNDYVLQNCDLSALPVMWLKIGGKQFPLTPEQYVDRFTTDAGTIRCVSRFKPSGYGNSRLWILGDVFVGSYYTVFDYANRRVGFAHLKN